VKARTYLSLRALAAVAVAAVSAASLFAADGAMADEPEIIFRFPHDGDVIAEPPTVLQMCFKGPVNVKDKDKGGDFDFSLKRSDGIGLGLRIVFQPDGYGVAVYPGSAVPEDPPDGEWTWQFRVVDAATGDALEETVKFTVSAGEGQEIVQGTPPACLAGGVTQPPTSPGESPEATTEPEDDDSDISGRALATIGVAGGAALIAIVGFLIRRRVGFWLHRPPERGPDGQSEDSGDHH
jgi:hypothetical protein